MSSAPFIPVLPPAPVNFAPVLSHPTPVIGLTPDQQVAQYAQYNLNNALLTPRSQLTPVQIDILNIYFAAQKPPLPLIPVPVKVPDVVPEVVPPPFELPDWLGGGNIIKPPPVVVKVPVVVKTPTSSNTYLMIGAVVLGAMFLMNKK